MLFLKRAEFHIFQVFKQFLWNLLKIVSGIKTYIEVLQSFAEFKDRILLQQRFSTTDRQFVAAAFSSDFRTQIIDVVFCAAVRIPCALVVATLAMNVASLQKKDGSAPWTVTKRTFFN